MQSTCAGVDFGHAFGYDDTARRLTVVRASCYVQFRIDVIHSI